MKKIKHTYGYAYSDAYVKFIKLIKTRIPQPLYSGDSAYYIIITIYKK